MAEAIEPVLMERYVPQVRIFGLCQELQKTAEPGTPLERLVPDLISVEVTRRASGPGDYKLTLSNWDPTLVPFTPSPKGEEPPARWTRHKYNELAPLTFGKRLRIEMRYLHDPEVDWVPMISGPITDMQFTFASDGDRVSITGEDDLRRLKDHVHKRIPHNKKNEALIFTDTLDDAKYPLTRRFDNDWPEHLNFLADETDTINEAHEQGQSRIDFLQKFVDRYDLELFLEFEERAADPEKGFPRGWAQVLRLARSRANVGPASDGEVLPLQRNRDLIDFAPTIKVADIFTEVHLRGRNPHRDVPEGIDGKAREAEVVEELDRYQVPGDFRLEPATKVREKYFGPNVGPNGSKDGEKTNLDRRRAEAAARAILLRKARELLTIQVTTVGRPELQPGGFVKIEDMGPPFDGRYYVTSTTHTWGSDGLRTRFSACRPGMPIPPYLKPKGATP